MNRPETIKQANDIFPSQVMNNTLYDHYSQHYTRGQYLYLVTLGLIVLCFISLFFIKVPISIRSGGILIAMNATAKESLTELSTDSVLIAQVYVDPADISLIKEGMEVDVRVDVYDYNLWGTIHGTVSEISSNAKLDNGASFFIVRCSLQSPSLQLPNGYTGKLKKGMTVQAGFLITERRLYQLLSNKSTAG